MRLATALAIRGPLDDVLEQAAVVDALGYESIWVPEIAGRDALVACAVIGRHVERATVATGVVPLPARSATTLAMGAAALDEATGGRFVLGVGAGHPETARAWFGRRPLTLAEIEDHLSIVTAILTDGELRRRTTSVGPAIDFRLRGVHPTGAPPILLAALGPRMARLAGAATSGLVLNWVTAPHAARIASWAREGAERAGRDPDDLEIACYLPTCVGDKQEARSELERQLRAYGAFRAYRNVLVACGMEAPDEGREVAPTTLDALGAHGDEAEVRARVEEFVAAGVTLPVLAPYPVGDDPWASMTGTWAALSPGG